MEQPEQGEQPAPRQPWGRLLRLGAEEGEPHVLLWKREWTIGRRRGCDLSFPSNKLVSGDHCKIVVDEKSGQVVLEDTSTNGTVINKLKVVKKQSCPLQTGDVIYLVYRKNEPEHNVAYLYESLNEKQGMTQESFEANKENVFHMTKDTSGAGRGDEPQLPPPSPATQACFEEPQPSTSTSDLFPTASTSSMEPASAGRELSSSGSGGAGISTKGHGPFVASGDIFSSASALPVREGASFSLSEPQDQEDLEPNKKRMKGDRELDLNLHLLVTDQCRNTQTICEEVRAVAVKPDKMEETLTCIICQDLLHDCVSPACTHSVQLATLAGWSARPCAPHAAVQWNESVKTTSSTTSWKRTLSSIQTRVAAKKTCEVWMPGTKSLKTCCSPKSGGLFLMKRGVQRTCWSCQTLTVNPQTLVSHTSCADSVLSTDGGRHSPFPAQHPTVSQGLLRLSGTRPRRLPASQEPQVTCVPCKAATPYVPAASSPCLTGEQSASRTPVLPLSSVQFAYSPSATCTGVAPGPAASAAWPHSVSSTWATSV
ncbi:PREDICTED: E3 ubiquitin-protein ligase CHFR isoform X5 [Galeopterus variegatus]|uniref:E3 ubiquitin-protein ligase CHFR isoform X5 n=1 Tax=Galeopterus variegatus TaxID=482537 RepID=A0ABM0Q7R2_GALVR|nr:PREDICTED: E3 ubiquitin-protein ligase CHFR isoform X5 [Galeopterus variegatus]